MKEKSTFGLDKNVACMMTYVLGWVSGLVFFLMEKKDKEVRFHALQSIIAFGAITVIQIVISRLPVVGWALSPVISLGTLVLWLVMLIKTYQGEKIVLPIIGPIAEKEASK